MMIFVIYFKDESPIVNLRFLVYLYCHFLCTYCIYMKATCLKKPIKISTAVHFYSAWTYKRMFTEKNRRPVAAK